MAECILSKRSNYMKHFLKKLIPIVLALAIIASIGWYFFVYDTSLTRDIILQQARRFEDNDKPAIAVWLYNLAYLQSGNDEIVALELAEQFKSIGNYSKAEATLTKAIKDGGGVDVYIALCKTYVEQDKLRDAVTMLDRVGNSQIKQQLDALRPQMPQASAFSGTYDQYLQISFTAEEGTLYVTSQRDYPSIRKDCYTDPLSLTTGRTTVYALSIGENGLVSPLAVYSYIIEDVVEEVSFTDAYVEAAIRQQMDLSEDEIIYSNMLWNVDSFTMPQQAGSCADLKWLPGLKNLTIENCTFSDFSPIANLHYLQNLKIANCNIADGDLSFLAALTTLTDLTISDCGISTIAQLAGLTAITYLDLSHNTIRNISYLSAMEGLKKLYLSGNAVISLKDIQHLTSLQELDVSYNSLATTEHVASLVHLKFLDVTSNDLMELKGMEPLTELEHFAAAYNNLTGIDILQSCTQLRTLNVSHNTLLNIQIVNKLTKLEELDFSHNEVSRLPSFSKDCALTVIRGNNNLLSSLDNLAGLANLTHIYMDYNANLSNIKALQQCKSLREVHVYGTKVTDISVLANAGIMVHYTPAG